MTDPIEKTPEERAADALVMAQFERDTEALRVRLGAPVPPPPPAEIPQHQATNPAPQDVPVFYHPDPTPSTPETMIYATMSVALSELEGRLVSMMSTEEIATRLKAFIDDWESDNAAAAKATADDKENIVTTISAPQWAMSTIMQIVAAYDGPFVHERDLACLAVTVASDPDFDEDALYREELVFFTVPQ